MIVVVLAVIFVGELASAGSGPDILYMGGAVASVIVAIAIFTKS